MTASAQSDKLENGTLQLATPKYQQLAQQIRAQIESGGLLPGERLLSFHQMRAQHGVTYQTVEKIYDILQNDGLIVREPGRGTFVLDKKGRRDLHNIIGVTGYGFGFSGSSSYWADLLNGVRAAAEKAGQQILLLNDNSSVGWEKADGVLVCDWSAYEAMRHVPPHCPCVSLLVPIKGVASVCADDYAGVRALTEHLIFLGHRRIAYLHGTDAHIAARRIQGYQDALKTAKIRPSQKWRKAITSGMDYGADYIRAGHDMMRDWLASDWGKIGCTAILAHNDETALGVIEALRETGVLVPQQISVAGFDGLDIGAYASPSLTTCRVPLPQIGAQAFAMLQRQFARDEVDIAHEIIKPQLEARQSTGRAPQ